MDILFLFCFFLFFNTSNPFSLHSINIFLLILSFLQGDKLYPMLGLSCFAYLLLVEEMEDMNFPAVFRYSLLLTSSLYFLLLFLGQSFH